MKKRYSRSTSLNPEALFRYQVVSKVLCRERIGEPRPAAIEAVAGMAHTDTDGELCTVSKRSIYRWLKGYRENGFDGLLPAQRPRVESSAVLSSTLLDFCKAQKDDDPQAAIPELIKRARAEGIIPPAERVSRVTLWRSLKRMGLDTSRRKTAKLGHKRRFAFPHRMDMVLCDGKHFRAGVTRARRVALFFIDDATRLILGAVVGPAESAQLFLRGLFQVIKTYGLMSALYVDNGSGFKAHDAIEVLRKLDVLFIHGTPHYPQGRGAVERFNRTAHDQLFRFFDQNPEVDPDCASLELRINHYAADIYNRTPHEGLALESPWARFQADPRTLRFPESLSALRQMFVLHLTRRVAADNIVQVDGQAYEVVAGYAGAIVTLRKNVLDSSLALLHQGRLVRLAPVDLHANARRERRIRIEEEQVHNRPAKSHAEKAFQKEYRPIVNPDGGFLDPDHQ